MWKFQTEAERLADIITDARLNQKIPGDPACQICGGYATQFDDHGKPIPCECCTPEGLEAFASRLG